jgi:S-formylglutathione hydrolase FrmB
MKFSTPFRFAFLAVLVCAACKPAASNPKGESAETTPESAYRVMAGVSMGGYGAAYLGTKYDKLFDLVGVMGGPMDWVFLDHYIETNLMGGFLDEPGLDYTYERWYPGIDAGSNFKRDEYVELMADMALTWGNQVTYNPKSTYYPTGIDPANASQMAALDAYHGAAACAAGLPTDSTLRLQHFYDGEYNAPAAPYCTLRFAQKYPDQATAVAAAKRADGLWDVMPFCDGGDTLGRTLDGKEAGDGITQWGSESPDEIMKTALMVDCNGNGKRDAGEPVIRNFSEPFDDCGTDALCDADEPGYSSRNPDPHGDDYDWASNPGGTEGNWQFDGPSGKEPGETYQDIGLDGLAGTAASPYDFGEGNGTFDANPNRARALAKNPLSLLAQADLNHQKYWIDAGVKDTFYFQSGAERFAGELKRLGEDVGVYAGFDKLSTDASLATVDWARLPKNLLTLYGNPAFTVDEALDHSGDGGHVGTPTQVVQRAMYMFTWISKNLPPGDTSPASDLTGYPQMMSAESKILGRWMKFGVSLPPGYCANESHVYPVVYFLHGYGMDPEGLVTISYLLNLEMANGRMQKMIIVYPNGHALDKGTGSFFVNHVDDSGQDVFQYEDYYVKELIPYIDENFRTHAKLDRNTPNFGCAFQSTYVEPK